MNFNAEKWWEKIKKEWIADNMLDDAHYSALESDFVETVYASRIDGLLLPR
jgi:hypothetical protein